MNYTPPDHSLTYKNPNLKNLLHICRLRRTLRILDRELDRSKPIKYYADFGSSNGYITNLISKKYKIQNTRAIDWQEKHFLLGRKNYPQLKFIKQDLNKPFLTNEKYDLITCFSTLEHVGNISFALNNLLQAGDKDSLIFLTVPIEIGIKGIIIFILKNIFYSRCYPMDELNGTKFQYLRTLLWNKDVSSLRKKGRTGYGTHFGFSYKNIDRILDQDKVKYRVFNDISTRYYLIKL